jgi:hypothetical protein
VVCDSDEQFGWRSAGLDGEHPRSASDLLRYGVALFGCLSVCRERLLHKLREERFGDKSVKEVVHEMFSYADGCTMSAKTDGLANIGGFLCTNDDQSAQQEKGLLILTRRPSYLRRSGWARSQAIAVGLEEGSTRGLSTLSLRPILKRSVKREEETDNDEDAELDSPDSNRVAVSARQDHNGAAGA